MRIGNGDGKGIQGDEMEDEETAMMRRLDEKAAEMEE